jgi:vacuolar-type H+-ATPase subunit H
VRSKDRQAPPESPLARGTAERLAAIVEAAERAAVTVIDDAEEQARRHLEEAQAEADGIAAQRLAPLSDLADSLIAQAESIRDQSERLLSSLESAKRQLAAEAGGPGRGTERAGRAPHLSAVGELDANGSAEAEREAGERRTPAGARLLATQMAVSGSSREEIESRLRNGFEIEDTGSILDAILGPED